jgi:hypothetical protein
MDSSNRTIGIVILVVGFLIFLFLSMFFGGFIMIVGAIIALLSGEKKQPTALVNEVQK